MSASSPRPERSSSPPEIACHTWDASQSGALPVEVFATGWQTALQRFPKVEVWSPWEGPTPPEVVSLRVRRPEVAVRSFVFHPPATLPAAPERPKTAPRPGAAAPPSAERRRTRVQAPDDVVKLQDRLYYLLQPSLEQILQTSDLRFPFDPFEYQLAGIAFLYSRHAAVLADEMGLGKTMQAISTIRLLVHAGELRDVLLVCPKPLVTNWRREFGLWAPELPVAVIEGDPARRRFQWELPQTPIKIANYEALMRDRDVIEGDVRFDLVVLDEAQRIKNRNSTTSEVVRSLNRTRSWALTGTPIENSPEDLVGVFEFLAPGHLRSEMDARRLGQAAGPYILRRTKDMVLKDLPPKLFRDAELSLTTEQWETYKTAEDEGVLRLRELEDSLTIQHVFELVLRLKQICNFDPPTGASAKLERLQADLEEVVASGKKAIIFSQWVHTLDQLAERLAPLRPLQYHGRIPSARRDGVIAEFREDKRRPLLLMSYGAGSVGLNLQFCGYVFLFDRWWNPAVEDQAINRAHRIGAAGPVTVTRMLMTGTIEERINQVLEDKRRLFASVFAHSEAPSGAGLTQDEIFGLFNLRKGSGIRDQKIA